MTKPLSPERLAAERKRFESAYAKRNPTRHVAINSLGDYIDDRTAAAWEMWKIAISKDEPAIKWRTMGAERPKNMSSIMWREPNSPGIGIGWYCDTDLQEWQTNLLWMYISELIGEPNAS